jgi:hypothetical protein
MIVFFNLNERYDHLVFLAMRLSFIISDHIPDMQNQCSGNHQVVP